MYPQDNFSPCLERVSDRRVLAFLPGKGMMSVVLRQ